MHSRRWLAPVSLLSLAAFLGALWISGVLPRRAHLHQLEEAAAARVPTYAVATATLADAAAELTLPSSVEASQETPLYPRVHGYVKRIVTDIGAKVHEGDLLAEIETPEVDQQVSQGRAALEQARANLTLATAGTNCRRPASWRRRKWMSAKAPWMRARRMSPRRRPTCSAWRTCSVSRRSPLLSPGQ
jgi:multidrug efflux pump subunit AcrA (membrane-fusion protein)